LKEGYNEEKRLKRKKTPVDTYITNNICYLCKNSKTFTQSSKGVNGICSCIPMKIKIINKKFVEKLIQNVETIVCMNCKEESRKINDIKLCLLCKDTNKVTSCLKCMVNFAIPNDSNEKICSNCIHSVKKCKKCPEYIILTPEESHKSKYDTCLKCWKTEKENEQLIDITCEKCSEPCFIPIEDLEWRKKCPACWKNDSVCKCKQCNNDVKIYTSKKENKNKGKKFYNCESCNHFEWL
jgi:hypothetical protein